MQSYQSYAEYYHDLTKYTPDGITQNQHRLDFSQQPVPFKEYPNKKQIDLSCLLPLDGNPFSDAGIKNPAEFTPNEKLLYELSRLLYFSNGITAAVQHPDRPFYMRASPSAGGLYPTEIYLLTKGYEPLEDGIYNYQSLSHSLTLLHKKDFSKQIADATFNNAAIGESKIILILTGVFYRSSWRYQDRAYRRICLDTGHVLGNIDLVSYPANFKAVLIGGFHDGKINEILSLDEEEEQTLAVVALIDRNAVGAIPAIGEACQGQHELPLQQNTLPSRLDAVSLKTPEGQRLIQLHNRSRIEKFVNVPNIPGKNIEDSFKFSSKVFLSEDIKKFNWKTDLFDSIMKRRSTRTYSGEPITREQLGTILSFAYKPQLYEFEGLDPEPVFFDLSLIETFVAVNNIEGLEEGCYFYSTEGNHLRQVRFKNFREEICYLCLGQELGFKASAVIFHTCDLSKAIFKYGERAYRYIHMDAGHLGQKINLAAINLGLGVSGIGGFFDDNVNEILGIPEAEAVVYITTLGVPGRVKSA